MSVFELLLFVSVSKSLVLEVMCNTTKKLNQKGLLLFCCLKGTKTRAKAVIVVHVLYPGVTSCKFLKDSFSHKQHGEMCIECNESNKNGSKPCEQHSY